MKRMGIEIENHIMVFRSLSIRGLIHSRNSKRCRSIDWLAFACIISVFFTHTAFAQKTANPFPQINREQSSEGPENISPAPGATITGDNIKDKVEKLNEALKNARQAMVSERETLPSTSIDQPGVSEGQTQERMMLLIKRVLIYEQHIEYYRILSEIQRATNDLSIEIKNWKGFDDPPPYPISLVDELRDAIDAKKMEIKKDKIEQSITEADLKEARKSLLDSEQHLRQIKEELEKVSTIADRVRLNRVRDLYQLENDIARAKTTSSEKKRHMLNEGLAYHHNTLNFLERKLQIASADARFTKEELDTKLNEIETKRTLIGNKLRNAIRDDIKRQERLQEARSLLRKARESLAGEMGEPGKITGKIERLQSVVDVRKNWVETTGIIVAGLKLSLTGLDAEQLFWEKRYKVLTTGKEADLREAQQEINNSIEHLRDNQFQVSSDLKSTITILLNERRRLTGLSPEDKKREFASQTIEAYEKRSASLEHLLLQTNEFIRMLERFQEGIKMRRQQLSAGERVSAFFASAIKHAGEMWNYELFAVEDTIIVDGESITERRPVTISKIVRALLILSIGLWLSSILARFTRTISMTYFKVEQDVANLTRKVFYTVSSVCVVFFAMITVKIPLTVFSYMGGALAIGVGFGAKNLINNFLSGIILLFEQPIKIGDIVEIEGTRGKVVRIGGRCSQIRRFDGIDILLPNSVLLEKELVNLTLSDKLLRVKVSVGVAYGSSTRDVSEVIANTVAEHGKILKNPKTIIVFEDFGDSALIFSVYFWIEVTPETDYRIIASDIRHMLDKRLRDAGITIAFPQRDIHLDSSRPIEIQINDKTD